jgi:hypothetical protein
MSTIQNFFEPNPTPITRSLLWQYNTAITLPSLVNQKDAWYEIWIEEFWLNWITDVFNLVSANEFGLAVWSIILNVPMFANVANADNPDALWGFNAYNPVGVPPTLVNNYQNFSNGNFSSSGESIMLTLEQQRWLLRMKYLKLISRCSIPQTNYNLNWLMLSTLAFPPAQPVSNPVVLTGTTVSGSSIITGLSSTSSLKVGMGVLGTGIPGLPYVVISSILSSTSIEISMEATASGSTSLSFGLPTAWVLEDFDMTITYQFNFYLPSVLQRALNVIHVLPDPAGVKVLKEFWNGTAFTSF